MTVADVTAAASRQVVSFTSSYDGSTQEAEIQVPDGYTGGAHPVGAAVALENLKIIEEREAADRAAGAAAGGARHTVQRRPIGIP